MYEVVYRERENWDGRTYHLQQCPDLQSSAHSVRWLEDALRARGMEVVDVRDSDFHGVEALPPRGGRHCRYR